MFGPCQRVTASGSGSQAQASVIVTLHLCPVCDPVLLLWLLRLKPQIELIALSLADPHPLVLWHYPVIDGALEESKLAGREDERGVNLKRMHSHSRRDGINDGLRMRFRIRRLRKTS